MWVEETGTERPMASEQIDMLAFARRTSFSLRGFSVQVTRSKQSTYMILSSLERDHLDHAHLPDSRTSHRLREANNSKATEAHVGNTREVSKSAAMLPEFPTSTRLRKMFGMRFIGTPDDDCMFLSLFRGHFLRLLSGFGEVHQRASLGTSTCSAEASSSLTRGDFLLVSGVRTCCC